MRRVIIINQNLFWKIYKIERAFTHVRVDLKQIKLNPKENNQRLSRIKPEKIKITSIKLRIKII